MAGERKRFGSPRLHIMLKREGLVVNHKRTERIYSEQGLALRRKRRRKGAARARETIPYPVRSNQRWSMDFVSDSTVSWFHRRNVEVGSGFRTRRFQRCIFLPHPESFSGQLRSWIALGLISAIGGTGLRTLYRSNLVRPGRYSGRRLTYGPTG